MLAFLLNTLSISKDISSLYNSRDLTMIPVIGTVGLHQGLVELIVATLYRLTTEKAVVL